MMKVLPTVVGFVLFLGTIHAGMGTIRDRGVQLPAFAKGISLRQESVPLRSGSFFDWYFETYAVTYHARSHRGGGIRAGK